MRKINISNVRDFEQISQEGKKKKRGNNDQAAWTVKSGQVRLAADDVDNARTRNSHPSR